MDDISINKNSKKVLLFIIGIILVLVVITGITYAYFRYFRGGLVNSNLTSGEISLDYTEGVSTIDLDKAYPISDYQGMNSENSFTFGVTGKESGIDTLIEYKITAVYGDEVEGKTRFDDDAIKLYLTNTNGDTLYLGNPSNLSTGELLYKNYIRGNSEVTHNYTLKMWIGDNVIITDTPDAYDLTNNRVYTTSAYRNLFASVKINVDAYEIREANAPSLDDGMIPIKYNEASHEWVKADKTNTNNNWYNYNDKIWANVVLVTEESRANYLSDTITPIGTPITEEDILAYFVWIPRYKYKLFNVSTSSTVNPQEINIEFEKGTEKTGLASGLINGEYLTHPAFTFGSDELTGLWVGKFETSASTLDATSTTCRNSSSVNNCNNANILPSILPNVNSLRYQQVANQFITSLKFAGGTLTDGVVEFAGNTTYGLTQNTDSHMMKNTEWGAVTYLSHSKYGINSEIYINNSESMITGRSGGNVGGSVTPTTVGGTTEYNHTGYYTYDGKCATTTSTVPTLTECVDTATFLDDITKGTNSSTTGNIYGIYDMSGGAWEYVMGVMQDDNNPALPRSGYTGRDYTEEEALASRLNVKTAYSGLNINSGFNGMLYGKDYDEETSTWVTMYKEDGFDFPNNKYYNLYGSTTTRILGDATRETAGWYGDYQSWIVTNFPWFLRGGIFSHGISAGKFYFFSNGGHAFYRFSFRVVLAR